MRSWGSVVVILLSLVGGAAMAAPVSGPDLLFRLDTGVAGQVVRLAAEPTAWAERAIAMPETSPGLYALRAPAPWLPFLQYKFIVDGRWLADPSNPFRAPDGRGGENSVVPDTGFREDPWLARLEGSPEPIRRSLILRDVDGTTRPVELVIPRGAGPIGGFVYFQDGGDYLERASAATVLANLSFARRTPPLVGVFVPPRDRMREYALSEEYVAFLAETVVPAAEAIVDLMPADRRLVIGPSMGGLISLYAALRRPGVFGLAASQSGALWWDDERIVRLLEASPPGARLFIDAGTYESERIQGSNWRAARAARAAGFPVTSREYPSTHDWIAWRNRLAEILIHFFQR